MPILDPVELYSNGEYINEEVLNRPLNQMNTNINKINYRVDTLLQDDIVSETEGWSSSKIKFEFDNFSPNVFNDNIISPYFGWSSQKIASLFSGDNPILFNPFDDNIVSTEYGWTSSKIKFELDKCCSGSGSGIRTPTPIYPLSGVTDAPQGVSLKADGYFSSSGIPRKHRTFQLDLSSGDFSSPLFESSVNSDEVAITYEITAGVIYKWRCRDEDTSDEQSAWSMAQTFSTGSESLIPTPILKRDLMNDLPSSINETEVLSVLITNWESKYSYTVQVGDGVFTQTDDSISWQMPSVSQDKDITITVQATDSNGDSSNVALHTITVVNVEIPSEADDVIQVTDYLPVDSMICESYGFEYI